MDSSDVRACALASASRAVAQGSPTGHFLSTARLFSRYIESGLSQTGPQNSQGLEVGVEGVSVRVDGLDVDLELTGDLVDAIRAVLN